MSKAVKAKVLDYFLERVGQVVTKNELREVAAPATEWARRLRELREDQGYRISSHIDRADLHPGEYVLETADPVPEAERVHAIPAAMRREVLERDGYTCQRCGAGAGDPDPYSYSRRIRLHVDHEDPNGETEPGNLIALCSSCNQSKGNVRDASEDARNLLARIRKAPRTVQREVYDQLRNKFEPASRQAD
jgi:hypothetical protein